MPVKTPPCSGARPLLLLHGLGFSGDYWQLQKPALASDRPLLTWNMPGHGGTPSAPQMTFGYLAESLAAFLDDAAVARADILGHSMGGMLALDFAARFPDRLGRLILFGASPAFPPPESDFAKGFMRDQLAPLEAGGTMEDVAEAVISRHLGIKADPTAASLIRACLAQTTPQVYRQTLHCLGTFDRRAALDNLKGPVLVLAAEHDLNAPASGAERMAAKITCVQYQGARFHCLPGLGHLANLENPDLFNAAILDFLNAPVP